MKVVTTKSACVLAVILLMVWTAPLRVAVSQEPEPCAQAKKYEISSFGSAINPLRVQRVRGSVVIQNLDGRIRKGEIPRRVCLGLFLADSHKFVLSTTANESGIFDFGPIEPGKYRLVARAEAMCTGNVPVEVVKSGRKARHRRIVILFRIRALDVCTSADYAH